MTYIDTRLEDLEEIQNPTLHEGVLIYDRIRVFSGDGPARQFEAGQQRVAIIVVSVESKYQNIKI